LKSFYQSSVQAGTYVHKRIPLYIYRGRAARDNWIIVFGDFSGTFKIVSSQKTAKRKLVVAV